MKEELTTEMHYEFLEDMGVDKKSYFIFAACGMMKRTGCTKEKACERYGITVEEYDANIDRVLNSDDWWGEKKEEPKETIFDHNVTEEEIKELCGYLPTKDHLIDTLNSDEHIALIYRLYSMRGNKIKAKTYFDKLPDTLEKWFSLGNHCCFQE